MISEFKVSVCIIKTGETCTICKFEITKPFNYVTRQSNCNFTVDYLTPSSSN